MLHTDPARRPKVGQILKHPSVVEAMSRVQQISENATMNQEISDDVISQNISQVAGVEEEDREVEIQGDDETMNTNNQETILSNLSQD